MVAQRPLGKDLFWWLSKTGLISLPATSPVARHLRKRGGDLVIGTSMTDARHAGVATHRGSWAPVALLSRLQTAATWQPDTIVWATGFRRDYAWIDIPGAVERGEPIQDRGRSRVPGLSFIGLPWQWTRGSALLGYVKNDAQWLAEEISRELHESATKVASA